MRSIDRRAVPFAQSRATPEAARTATETWTFPHITWDDSHPADPRNCGKASAGARDQRGLRASWCSSTLPCVSENPESALRRLTPLRAQLDLESLALGFVRAASSSAAAAPITDVMSLPPIQEEPSAANVASSVAMARQLIFDRSRRSPASRCSTGRPWAVGMPEIPTPRRQA